MPPFIHPLMAQLQTTIPQDSFTPADTSQQIPAVQSLADMMGMRQMNTGATTFPKFTVDPNKGTIDAKDLPTDLIQTLMTKAAAHDQILAGFAQEQARIEAEARYKQSGPGALLNVLTTMAGNFASAPGMNPVVQAMGKTALAVNPTSDQLWSQAQNMAVATEPIRRGQTELYKAAGDIVSKMEDQRQRTAMLQLSIQKDREDRIRTAFNEIKSSITAGLGQFDVNNAVKSLQAAGATPEEIKNHIITLQDLSKNVGEKVLEDRRARKEQLEVTQASLNERERAALTRESKNLYDSVKSTYQTNTKLDVSESTAIRSAFNVMDLAKKMETVAKKQEPSVIGGVIQYANPFRNEEWQQLKLYGTQLLLSGLAGKLGAGVSDRDVEVMKSIVPTGKLTPEQFHATMRVLKSVNAGNLVRMMEINPNYQFWQTTKPLFERAGLGEVYKKQMWEMRENLGQSYPAMYGPSRHPLAEMELGPQTKALGQPYLRPWVADNGRQHIVNGRLAFLDPTGRPVYDDGNPIPPKSK